MNNKAAKSSWAVAFTVASVWFGTHVGGGFASGNQVINYFSQYGWTAAVYPIIAMGILALVMCTIMKFAKLNGFTNYKDTFSALYPKPWMEVFFEIFYIVILLAAVAAAVAGAGEVLANFVGVDYTVTSNKILFNLIIVAVLIILSIFGVKLVIAASGDLSLKGIKRANILGWLMNGLALAASGAMLCRWYPLLAALQNGGVEGFTNAVSGIPNQTVLNLIGIKWILAVFSILLFCAFVSTSVTLVFTMIQRFQGYCFPNAVKSEKARGVIVGVVVIAICFAISLLGLSGIIKYAYGYDGYYAILVIFIPTIIWGIPKVKKLEAEKKSQLSE